MTWCFDTGNDLDTCAKCPAKMSAIFSETLANGNKYINIIKDCVKYLQRGPLHCVFFSMDYHYSQSDHICYIFYPFDITPSAIPVMEVWCISHMHLCQGTHSAYVPLVPMCHGACAHMMHVYLCAYGAYGAYTCMWLGCLQVCMVAIWILAVILKC